MNYLVKYCLRVGLLAVVFSLKAQTETVVSGKIVESATGSPIPFANLVFQGTTDGGISDFDGNFTVSTRLPVDSLEVRYIGFVTRAKFVARGTSQVVNFQMDEDIQTLGEVIVYSGENPAFPIMRNVVRHKSENDKRALTAYDYEVYTKIEIDVDNMDDKFRERKLVRRITAVLDSIEQIAGEDGSPVLPIFMSEAISRYYFRRDPQLRAEHIHKTNLRGVGLTDGTTTSQVIGATFQQYNFYQNWMNILGKEFVSPIADGWRINYDIDLIDSLYMDGDYCYRLDFYPKSNQDLAFTGTMWIVKDGYALKRIDASIGRKSNLNYIEKIKIQQDLVKTSAGPWIPEKARVVVDMIDMPGNLPSGLAKFYTSVRDVVVNEPKEQAFYTNPVVLAPNAAEPEAGYWEANRHDSLTTTEENVYVMIDTLKRIPFVKAGMNMAKFAVTGYLKAGVVDLGPYTIFYGNNDIEGYRAGMGLRTNYGFSKKLTLGGHAAYGFGDEQWKYRAYADVVLARGNWSNLRYEHQKEVDQVWTLTRNLSPTSLYYSLSRYGTLVQPFSFTKHRLTYYRQHAPGLSQTLELKQQSFTPLFDYRFYPDPAHPDRVLSSFDISEVTLSTRFARDEIFVVNDNERWSLGTIRWPAITFDYSYGIPRILGSDLTYHRFKFRFEKRQKMGVFGVSNFDFAAGAILGNVHYPLLFNPIGNQTPAYASFTYNLMNSFEFSSDRYVSLKYRHSFEGLILNKIPVMKLLKWRLVGNANFMYGDIHDSNVNLTIYPLDAAGVPQLPFYTFTNKPYVELGYGVENIFKVLRIDAFHRITYLDHPNVNKFGLKFSVQVIL
ncbi:MAG: DUF5686 and carboxypeptidase regulatory-like domain-containing protein [Cyclobacteriaceae bacterium]|nr:DUF5686 and carboxypeptidase regulatory-like domain-containing protein [Cyclobacteriaceae bacterium]